MKTLVSLVIAAAVSVAGAASASEARIPIAGLDLSRAADAATFDARVADAARKLCRDARRPNSFLSDREYCEAAVRRQAVAGLPNQARADYAAIRATTDY